MGKGSTVGSYVLYQLARTGKAPKGIICKEAEPIVAVGAIIAGIPLVDKPESFNFKDNQRIRIDGDRGEVEIIEEPINDVDSGGVKHSKNHCIN
jgi:predicted aconitase with swiveling domain